MKHLTLLPALAIAIALMGCDQDDGATWDTPLDQPADNPGDTTGDTPWDTPADVPADTPVDTPMDTPVDTPTETPADTPVEDTGGTSDVERFCTIVCVECFGGTAPWMSRPASECIPECVDDMADCSPSDQAAIMACPGGDSCPAGVMGFATCVGPYTCILTP
jgi:hypothetical protein